MKIELILLGVIGVVFLLDFILNSIKKKSVDINIDRIEGPQPLKKPNLLNQILNRKKNITLSVIFVLISKICIHFSVYPQIINNGGWTNKYLAHLDPVERGIVINDTPKYAEFEAPFNYYIKNLFLEEIWLFMPAFILIVFFAWYFSDRIKAR